MPNGDYIEGIFNGSFNEGIKVNGTYRKGVSEAPSSNAKLAMSYAAPATLPRYYKRHISYGLCFINERSDN